ncbi:MAG: hypothetical protein OCD76_15585 [Reichenbachiella sp.]
MPVKFKNGEEYYNKIYLIFNLSVAVSLLPFGYLVLEKHANSLVSMDITSWQLWVISIPALVGIGGLIQWIRKKLIAEKIAVKELSGLRNKLASYYQSLQQSYFAFTGTCLLSVIMLYFTGSGIFIVVYVFIMIILSLNRPTLNLIIKDLNLSKEEEAIMVEKQEIL